uniref:Uncharacterized protein n=1 Tax=Musca domestica TaxID=7370 RepID=A0A1I8NL96_MUSDO
MNVFMLHDGMMKLQGGSKNLKPESKLGGSENNEIGQLSSLRFRAATNMKFYLLWVIALIVFHKAQSRKVKFTKLECFELDKPFATIKKCQLKALSRYRSALFVHVALHQVPVNNVSVNARFFRKGSNGYRLFMYNNTLDFCAFLKNPNRFMFWKIVFTNLILPFSNINHTCPFDHDIIVEKLILDSEMFKMIPFPADEYMAKVKVAAYNHFKAEIKAYLQISE